MLYFQTLFVFHKTNRIHDDSIFLYTFIISLRSTSSCQILDLIQTTMNNLLGQYLLFFSFLLSFSSQSLLKEGKKRLTLSDIYGVSAYTRVYPYKSMIPLFSSDLILFPKQRPPKQTINKNVLNAEMLTYAHLSCTSIPFLSSVMNHNARWVFLFPFLLSITLSQEEDKCYTIKRNIDRLEKQKQYWIPFHFSHFPFQFF